MDVTVIVPSFRTLDMTRKCVRSLRTYYPRVRLILVDDCSRDESAEYIRGVGHEDACTLAVINKVNQGEGVVFDLAIRRADTHYVFTLHSDCVVLREGFLEKMLEQFSVERRLFAIGWLRPTRPKGPMLYIAISAMMMDREKYLKLPPIINHGAPAIGTMNRAYDVGYTVADFPISHFIHHERSLGSTGEELKRQIRAGEICIEEIDMYWRRPLIKWGPIKGEIEMLRVRSKGEVVDG